MVEIQKKYQIGTRRFGIINWVGAYSLFKRLNESKKKGPKSPFSFAYFTKQSVYHPLQLSK